MNAAQIIETPDFQSLSEEERYKGLHELIPGFGELPPEEQYKAVMETGGQKYTMDPNQPPGPVEKAWNVVKKHPAISGGLKVLGALSVPARDIAGMVAEQLNPEAAKGYEGPPGMLSRKLPPTVGTVVSG